MTLFEEFKAFVETMPPSEKYNSFDNQTCALARFGKIKFTEDFKAASFTYIVLHSDRDAERYSDRTTNVLLWPENRASYALFNVVRHSKTYGELAKKLEPIVEPEGIQNETF